MMFNTLQLTEILHGSGNTATSYVLNFIPDKIAEVLGLNYDVETNVMYIGENSDNGIMWTHANSNIIAYLYINGTPLEKYCINFNCATSNIAKLFYKKTDKTIVFGVGTTETINFAIGKGVDVVNGTELYAYLYNAYSTSSTYNTGTYHVFTENGDYDHVSASLNTVGSDCIVSVSPLSVSNIHFIFNHIYTPYMFKEIDRCTEFTMNGKEYVSATCISNNRIRFVAEI